MSKETGHLTIGALAKAAGVGVETVRYYQRRGLISEPRRLYGTVRRYGEQDIRRLRFIRTAQELGFSLREIAELLMLVDGTVCEDAQKIATEKLKQVRTRKTHLERIEAALAALLDRCRSEGGQTACPLIDALEEGNAPD
jgi:MerR family transcriptional regulator, mercuric resistance operon regulatory protein